MPCLEWTAIKESLSIILSIKLKTILLSTFKYFETFSTYKYISSPFMKIKITACIGCIKVSKPSEIGSCLPKYLAIIKVRPISGFIK